VNCACRTPALRAPPDLMRGTTDRVSVTSPAFAQRLHALLAPHLPGFPAPASTKRPAPAEGRTPKAMNSNIRLYRYDAGQYFGPHYDDAVRDAASGLKSEWTLCVAIRGG
jgi:hypothetical protein